MKSWSAQLKACCRIGGWNHHSGHRAMIVCNKCTQRSAIVFLTPGQLAGQMHTPRIHCKEHTQTKKLVSNTKSGPKTGSISGPTICSLACWAGFRGRWLVCETGLATQLFFLLLPYHLGLSMAAAATILCVPPNRALLVVSSPRPRWFQLSALNLVSKAQALADMPHVGPVFGVSKQAILASWLWALIVN